MKARTIIIEKEGDRGGWLVESVITITGTRREVEEKMEKAVRKVLREIGISLRGVEKEEKEEMIQEILDEGMLDPYGHCLISQDPKSGEDVEYTIRIVDFPFHCVM